VRFPVTGYSNRYNFRSEIRARANPLESVVLDLLNPLLLLALLLSLAAGSASAVDPNTHISQYGHTAWRIQDGFFGHRVVSITQTTDGYVWVGTVDGLFRFDGVRFTLFDPGKNQQLPNGIATSLLGARDGSLWIGGGSTLSRWANQKLVTIFNLHASGDVTSIVEDQSGNIWFNFVPTSSQSELCEVVEMAPRCFGPADGLNVSVAYTLALDSQGSVWIGGADRVVRWQPGSSDVYPISALRSNEGLTGVAALAANPNGGMWVGIAGSGRGKGLQQLIDGKWRPFRKPDLDGSTVPVTDLLEDREGALWIATADRGIYRLYGGRVEHFDSAAGLSGDLVFRFYQDREGNLWVVTSGGVDLFRDLPVVTYSTHEGLSTQGVNTVFASRDGTIWVGGFHGLDALRGDKVKSVRTGKGLPGSQVEAIFEDRAGQLWVGTDKGLFLYKGGRFKPISRPDGSPIGHTSFVAEDVDGNIWASNVYKGARRLTRIHDYRVQEEFSPPQIPAARVVVADPRAGVWLGLLNGDLAWLKNGRPEIFHVEKQDPKEHWDVEQLIVNPDGSVFGTTRSGLVAWKNGKGQMLTVRNGLPCNAMHSVVTDANGNLWLYADCGLIEIARDEVQKWWNHPDVVLQMKVLDVFDGAQGARASFSGAARSVDGRLWFANGTVLQTVDPAHIALNELAPPVHVEDIIADRKHFLPDDGLRIPPLTRDLEIDYTALSFGVPQKVLFRYKLGGRDVGWQDSGTRREAFYTDLRPGKYKFHVIACNNDGVWNEQGATLDFIVAPAWFQTNWFLALCVATGIFIVWACYVLRVRQVTRALSARFDERLGERTRVARELHDTFLQTVQGSKMVADDALEQRNDPARMRRSLEQLSDWLGRATQEGRAALNSLRTSTTEKNDLAEALERAVEECRIHSPMQGTLSVVGDAKELHPVVRDEVYRIGYEAIRNACAHSGCTRLEVGLNYTQDLAVRVSDNGTGMDSDIAEKGKAGHFGLQGMRERALRIGGKLSVISSPRSGTEITILVPGRIAFQKPSATKFKRIRSLFGSR
jgi:ligand-binding sensor domain-containing protein/signal transduction histidine kinase